MRTTFSLLATSALLSGAAFAVAPLAVAAAPVCTPADPTLSSVNDINGDARSDLVVGVPNATVQNHANAGAVDVHFRDENITDQLFSEYLFGALITPHAGDRFGTSVSLAHLGSPCAAVVVGAPGVRSGRGAVFIAFGSNGGVDGAGALRINGRTAGERFGTSVAAAGSDIWISAPNRTVNRRKQAGAVYHYRIVNGAAKLVQTITQATRGVADAPEAGDHFGQVLAVQGARRVVIGIPGEDVRAVRNAGAVTALFTGANGKLSRSYTVTENSRRVAGRAQRGDQFGASVTITAGSAPNSVVGVGAPGEAAKNARNAGHVYIFGVAPRHAFRQQGVLSQEHKRIPGRSAAGDRFGASIVFDGDRNLLVGVPGKNLAAKSDAGEVVTFFWNGTAPTDVLVLRQGGGGEGELGGAPRTGARVGAAVGLLATDDNTADSSGGDTWLVAIPGAAPNGKAGAGKVVNKFHNGFETFTDSAGPQQGEHYGALPNRPNNGPNH
jgi:hypothetical protein